MHYFHIDIFTDTVFGQQVQFPQVFQLEDPGVGDLVYIQRAVMHGQRSAMPSWWSSTKTGMGPRDCRDEHFTD
jgi:hypothetical protein